GGRNSKWIKPGDFTAAAGETFLIPPGCQRWPARAGGTRQPGTGRCAALVRARLRGAISPALPEALRYPAAACRRSARAGRDRRKTPPPAAETQNPSAFRPVRIGRLLPWRKRSLPKCFSASSSTADISSRFRQRRLSALRFSNLETFPGVLLL